MFKNLCLIILTLFFVGCAYPNYNITDSTIQTTNRTIVQRPYYSNPGYYLPLQAAGYSLGGYNPVQSPWPWANRWGVWGNGWGVWGGGGCYPW